MCLAGAGLIRSVTVWPAFSREKPKEVSSKGSVPPRWKLSVFLCGKYQRAAAPYCCELAANELL